MGQIVQIGVAFLGAYFIAGVLFSFAFLAKGMKRVDEGTHGAKWKFKAIVWPGIVCLWPALLLKWLKA